MMKQNILATDTTDISITSEQSSIQKLPWHHRRRWIRFYLQQKLQAMIESKLVAPGKTVLDYGCGDKPYESIVRKKFDQYIGVDLAATTAADYTIAPDSKLPVDDQSIDLVLSTQVLEHVKETNNYLQEAHRVLRINGCLLLSTHGVWPYHPCPDDYWRWTIDGLKLIIQQAGFEILEVQSVFGLLSVSLQLWQDGTEQKFPSPFRQIYVGLIQSLIGYIEAHNEEQFSDNASVYIILAQRKA
ncbi:MAG: class I SAM-dependent methyltransferase [Waterburya sp.]